MYRFTFVLLNVLYIACVSKSNVVHCICEDICMLYCVDWTYRLARS